MRNCTVAGNFAGYGAGGIKGAGRALNSIVFFNSAGTAPAYSNYYNASDSLVWTNCCTAPNPTNYSKGTSCISINPDMVNMPSDCRLLNSSSCIGTGLNQDWMTNALDMDGHMRIQGGLVDMGAYEWFPKGTIFWGD